MLYVPCTILHFVCDSVKDVYVTPFSHIPRCSEDVSGVCIKKKKIEHTSLGSHCP